VEDLVEIFAKPLAFSRVGAEEMRLYSEGRLPVVGLDAARKALSRAAAPRHVVPLATHVAGSGDLGYSYGATEPTEDDGPGGFSYTRIWKRDDEGAWRIVLDIATPAP
jgi:ketosteroid isomerase-like protein